MSTVRVIELLSESNQSWEDAAQKAVSAAAKSVRNIKSVYVKEMTASVENNSVTSYRLNAKVSFVVEE